MDAKVQVTVSVRLEGPDVEHIVSLAEQNGLRIGEWRTVEGEAGLELVADVLELVAKDRGDGIDDRS